MTCVHWVKFDMTWGKIRVQLSCRVRTKSHLQSKYHSSFQLICCIAAAISSPIRPHCSLVLRVTQLMTVCSEKPVVLRWWSSVWLLAFINILPLKSAPLICIEVTSHPFLSIRITYPICDNLQKSSIFDVNWRISHGHKTSLWLT